jgi:hypothetical protein
VGGACARASTSFLAIRSQTEGSEPRNTAIMSIHKLLSQHKPSTIAGQGGGSGKNFLFETRLANILPKRFQSEIQTEQM